MVTDASPAAADSEVIASSLDGPERFAAGFDRYAGILYRYVSFRLGPELAEDLALPARLRLPAYAVKGNQDGSINIKIYDLREPEQLEQDLAGRGVTADITYLPLGKRCGNTRAPVLEGDDLGVAGAGRR
ncbi:unnamed protein product [[Actinomadura] parvosata subsp. kistnae]|uniref:hypothetical protein n=1 Tax=[Actinomadura] parvosata TaxID=1955412 RepID=UPI000D2C3EC6|nr:unnamed protein product [Actinomadura parvosata subsp. kistnae]